jgi:hypothetical protein
MAIAPNSGPAMAPDAPGAAPSHGLTSHFAIACQVEDELAKAQRKFPPFNSAHEGWAIIKEELDELWEVVRQNQATPGRAERLKQEAIQVAAMAMRFIHDLPGFKN